MAPRIDICTIFPTYFDGPFREALLGKAIADGLLDIHLHDLRDHTSDKHRTVDDTPFGGGPGMVMKPEPWFDTVEAIPGWADARRILFTPAGRRVDQSVVEELVTCPHLILMCGRYEGVDERVSEHLATDELSVGDLVLSGGEVAAALLVEAISRLVDGVIGDPASVAEDSFTSGMLDFPHYTRPADYRGHEVPDVLRSGDHARIAAWRRDQAERRTRVRRPDLLAPDA